MDQDTAGRVAQGQVDPDSDSDLANEIALEMLRAGRGRDAETYLKKKIELLELQIRHFDEDYGLRRLGERFKIAIQALLVLTGLALMVVVCTMVWSASHSQSVVVDDFESPPDMAQKGGTGRVVATGVLDELSKLQSATRSSAGKLLLKSAWAGDIKIAIPQTGVSLGELERTLRLWLGHDLHIGGSLMEEAGGLALTVRGDGIEPKTFTGGPSDLRKLSREAAEYIYGEAEPALYATWLTNTRRYGDAVRFISQVYPRVDDRQRPALANTWGNALSSSGHIREAVDRYRLSVSIDPHYWKSWANLVGAISYVQGEEAAYRVGMHMQALARSSPSDDQPRPVDLLNFLPLKQDWPALLRSFELDVSSSNGAGTQADIASPFMADFAARMHDWQGAARYLAASDPDDPITRAQSELDAGYRAIERGDYAGAVAPLQAFYGAWSSDMNIRYNYFDQPCFLGLALGMSGRDAEAWAVFTRAGRWQRCEAYRAMILEHKGDWRTAAQAYRAAIALAPDLPFAYNAWGEALARRGDLAGAAAAFREANKRGPHWADPLKNWGDVLRRLHQPSAARAKYEEATRYAPRWQALARAKAS
jgi:tetratricopeptide (TPR) repeat protein